MCSHLVGRPCPVFFALLVRGSVLALPVSAGLGEQGDVARKVEHSQSVLTLPPGLYQCVGGDVVMAVPKLSEIPLAHPFCGRLWGRNVVVLQLAL